MTVVTVLLKAVFPGVEPDRQAARNGGGRETVPSAHGWSRRGSLTRSEYSAVVLSTAHSAELWRVQPCDALAGDAIYPPTPPQSLPGETSIELDTFPELRPRYDAAPGALEVLVLIAACPGRYVQG